MLTPPSSQLGVPGFTQNVLVRPRLLDELRNVLHYRLTLISAPAGFGKTSLAIQLAEHTDLPVAWQTLSRKDRDLPTLHANSLRAFAEAGLKTPGPQPAAPADSPENLAGWMTRALPDEPILYILDDVQHLTGAQRAEAWLAAFLENMPETCHLVLVGRNPPNLPLVEMIAQSQVFAIGKQQLAFTDEEVRTLAKHYKTDLPPAPAIQSIKGWPVGVALLLNPQLRAADVALDGNPDFFGKLAGELLGSQPVDIQDFLLTSSTLNLMTPHACQGALGLRNAQSLLSQIMSKNLFAIKASSGVVYHDLFREFLQKQLKNRHPEIYTQLHSRAAAWFVEADELAEAFDHYIASEQIGTAAELTERVASSYFMHERHETLLHFDQALQNYEVAAPRLRLYCGMIQTNRFNYEQANALLQDAAELFRKQADPEGLSNAHLQTARVHMRRGEYEAAIALAEAVRTSNDAPGHIQDQAYHVLGGAYAHLGNGEEAIPYLEEAAERFQDHNYALIQIYQDLEIAYMSVGDIKAAAQCLGQLAAITRKSDMPSARAVALNNLGNHFYESGQYQDARERLEEGLAVIATTTDLRMKGYLLATMGDLQRDLGETQMARNTYQAALDAIGKHEPYLRAEIYLNLSNLERWQNNRTQAASLAEEAMLLAEKHQMIMYTHMCDVLRLAANQSSAGDIEAIGAILEENKRPLEAAQVYAIGAATAMALNEETAAVMLLHKAIDTTPQLESSQRLFAEIVHNKLLLQYVLQNTSDFEDILERVMLLDAQQVIRAAVDATQTLELRVYTLGNDHIIHNGVVLTSKDWQSLKAKELFLYLLFHGKQSRQQICLDLWPDSSDKSARSSFHITVRRVRDALYEDAIQYNDVQDVYHLDEHLDIWCDATEMQRLVNQSIPLPPYEARAEDLWLRAVQLYGGEFLPTIYSEWTDGLRDSYEQLRIEAMTEAARCAFVRGNFKDAIVLYRDINQIDPYREDIHRQILRCYAELGQTGQVLSHYHRLEKKLRDDLDIPPEKETTNLIKRILR